MNTSSILESILQGRYDLFIPVDSPSEEEAFQSDLVNWNQEDYITVANSIHKFVWDEPLNNWMLNSMDFSGSCHDIENGLQDVYFVFYNILDSEDGKSRIVHNINIDPARSEVNVWAEKYSPLVMNWKAIDLGETKITADDALQIAEDNGGIEIRNSVNNECNVSVSFLPNPGDYDGWKLSYYQNPGTLLEVKVDPKTGEYR